MKTQERERIEGNAKNHRYPRTPTSYLEKKKKNSFIKEEIHTEDYTEHSMIEVSILSFFNNIKTILL